MPDHQTSPVGEDADFEIACSSCGLTMEESRHLAGRRAAPALDASGLPRVKTWQERYRNDEGQPDQRTCMLAEIADLRAQQAATTAKNAAVGFDGAAPTQPKAQAGASIDTPEFRMLEADFVKESVELSTKDHHADNTGLYAARTALIAHIDAWAGSRAGDAAEAEKGTT
jgi:hypothetical protein